GVPVVDHAHDGPRGEAATDQSTRSARRVSGRILSPARRYPRHEAFRMTDADRREFLKAAAVAATTVTGDDVAAAERPAELVIPEWVYGITRMGFLSRGQVDQAAKAGVQVVHTNVVWPYYPLRKDGGGLSKDDARKLRELAQACHDRGMKCCLG